MKVTRLAGAAASVAVVALAGCAPTTGGATTTSTTPPGHVAGLTENRFCAGPVSPSGCTTAFTPASDQVTVSRGTVLFQKLQSASNGAFNIDLAPGTYNIEASTTAVGGAADCPVVPVTITAGTTVAVTVQCTIELP